MSNGYFLMQRGWMDNPVFKREPFTDCQAWIWLIEEACYEPHDIRQGYKMISLKRGEVPTSYRKLREVWGWGNSKIIGTLKLWESCGMIAVSRERELTVITICNYDKYQAKPKESGTQTERKQNATGTQPETNRIKGNKGELNKELVTRVRKVSLNELSVDHIRSWLAKKRTEGEYLLHDEYFILDYFKNYCLSKGKQYNDYIAALRNAFEWDTCQPKRISGAASSATKDDRAKAAVMRGLAAFQATNTN